MTISIKPIPAQELANLPFSVREWVRAVSQLLSPTGSTPGTIPWANIDTTGSNVTDLVTRLHNTLQTLQGGTAGEYYHLTSAQHTDLTDVGDSALHYHATDRARANHTGTQLMATISDLPTLVSGLYTPTLTNVANISANTAYECQYIRVGSIVTVSGKLDVDPTSSNTITQLGISLPVASNLGAAEDCAGTGACPTISGQAYAILGDATNNRAELQWLTNINMVISETAPSPMNTANQSVYFTFTYTII